MNDVKFLFCLFILSRSGQFSMNLPGENAGFFNLTAINQPDSVLAVVLFSLNCFCNRSAISGSSV